ncbi:TetR/AcrR family transcriptional regulator C-terminal domain-containing protein [Solimonas terrae]|uniref:Tetracycline repressor TetR C-terminal domain-containing protein n=1 Tax=Solimonas terrae TaxID=1396819 RepID=A0A6M2BPC2_9GAMM|nr:TetR/AcrR family transcriptional regulator C-terminal domain-containing protein [Solimonas terrae]NGY04462.1 hypothetical protein [Solimonas terrae]
MGSMSDYSLPLPEGLRHFPAPRRAGRPSQFDRQAMIDAALQIGLDRVTLKAVAEIVGVSVSTLYRQVGSCDELIRLAAAQRAVRRPRAVPRGTHWSELAIQLGLNFYESFVSEPRIIAELLRGRLGPDVEMDFLEQFLAELCRCGFTAEEGVQIYRAVAMVAIGAAVASTAMSASAGHGEPHDIAVKRALAGRRDHELPLLRSALGRYLNLETQQWLLVLRDQLEGIAAARNERLPASIGLPKSLIRPQPAARHARHGKSARGASRRPASARSA